MGAPDNAMSQPVVSADYWRQIFRRNPDFCSWQSTRQRRVRDAIIACLEETPGLLHVLDFGIGNMGLYRVFDDRLMRRIALTGISESQQHAADEPMISRYRIHIETGPSLTPCARVADHSQDVVVCTYVFAYLVTQTRADALAAFARLLVPGGKLVLVLHHPRGERAQKFQRSQPFWPSARQLYEYLRAARYADARELLGSLTEFLIVNFGTDERYLRYLASYLKTAARFVSMFSAEDNAISRQRTIPDEALADCRLMQLLIDRERAMTCESFAPVEQPARDLDFPPALRLLNVEECHDPMSDAPIAHVVTATAK